MSFSLLQNWCSVSVVFWSESGRLFQRLGTHAAKLWCPKDLVLVDSTCRPPRAAERRVVITYYYCNSTLLLLRKWRRRALAVTGTRRAPPGCFASARLGGRRNDKTSGRRHWVTTARHRWPSPRWSWSWRHVDDRSRDHDVTSFEVRLVASCSLLVDEVDQWKRHVCNHTCSIIMY